VAMQQQQQQQASLLIINMRLGCHPNLTSPHMQKPS
jgi:hypothetical protein